MLLNENTASRGTGCVGPGGRRGRFFLSHICDAHTQLREAEGGGKRLFPLCYSAPMHPGSGVEPVAFPALPRSQQVWPSPPPGLGAKAAPLSLSEGSGHFRGFEGEDSWAPLVYQLLGPGLGGNSGRYALADRFSVPAWRKPVAASGSVGSSLPIVPSSRSPRAPHLR